MLDLITPKLMIFSVILMLSAIMQGCAVNTNVKTVGPKLSVVKIIEIKGVNKSELYSRAGEWLALTFVSSKAVIESKNSKKGRYIGNGLNNLSYESESGLANLTASYKYNIIIDVKDNKARIILDNYQLDHWIHEGYHAASVKVHHDDMWKLAIDFQSYVKTGGEYSAEW